MPRNCATPRLHAHRLERPRPQVEELIQSSRQYRADDKVNWEIAALKEAFARLQVGGGRKARHGGRGYNGEL